jgi:hypothetical protein
MGDTQKAEGIIILYGGHVFNLEKALFIALVFNETHTQKAEGILWWTCV